MVQIGQAVRRYTLVPLNEPVARTNEPALPPAPRNGPNHPTPLIKPERELEPAK
jgi:hypothetical protein